MIANPFASCSTSESAIITSCLQRSLSPTRYSQFAQWYGPLDANPASFVLFGQIAPTSATSAFKRDIMFGQFLAILLACLASQFVRSRFVDVLRYVLSLGCGVPLSKRLLSQNFWVSVQVATLGC